MLLEKLSNASGVSGNEKDIRQVIKDEITPLVDEVSTDTMGNLFATKKGGDNNLKVMLSAHMDEVGLFVDFVENGGIIRFKKIGGIDDRVLLSKKVFVGENKTPGVIGLTPIHLQGGKKKEVIKSDDMFIDIGATAKDDKLAKVGDTAVFATKFAQSGDILRGKAFDDRAGCGVLIELLKGTYPFTICGVFTVQEELGLRGAKIAAYNVNPDFAFALEGTTAGDTPTERDVSPSTSMGKGPAITFMDRSLISNKRLLDLLVDTAKKENIPFQFKRTITGGTDSGAIHLQRGGIPSITVSVPVRYIHSPVGLMNQNDFNNAVKLMEKSLQRVPELMEV